MCDTFVILPRETADHSLIFGKNSDREANEAQSLEFHPARNNIREKWLECTYIRIPQVRNTHAVLISRPFWMWGAEMGVNEKGVVIGNEAVFSWLKPQKEGVLTGMDINRIVLERTSSADEAVELIIELIGKYGQGGIGGYEDKAMAYNNSFLVADAGQAFVLEAVGPYWALKKITGHDAISNGLTIGAEYDRIHPEAIPFARKNGKLKRPEDFHFAACYSDWFYTTFSACRQRRVRSQTLLENGKGSYTLPDAFRHLRDHGPEPYRPGSHFLGNRVCAHAANSLSRNSMQTTGSLVVHLEKKIFTAWATGTSAPCLSLFKPVRLSNSGVLPSPGNPPGPHYDPGHLWWRHESLHRMVLKDFSHRSPIIRADIAKLEKQWISLSATVPEPGFYDAVTVPAFREEEEKMKEWLQALSARPVKGRLPGYYTAYWRKLNRKAQMPVLY